MKKLLVTGASGFLGWNLCRAAFANWQVYGTYRRQPIALPDATLLKVDLTDTQDLRHLFDTVRPDAVAHLAAQSSPNVCQTQPEDAYRVNVAATALIAELCADRAVSLAFTSTDLVFDGLNPPYRESDPVSPINRYGEQKALAEDAVLSRYPHAAVCRMPLMFGAAPPTASSFIQPWVQTLRSGGNLALFIDEFRTPVSATTAAQGILLALQQVHGRIHLGGKESISRYEFGRLMAEVLELPSDTVSPCRQQDVPMAAPRSPNASLDSSLAFGLGYAPRSLREELEALKGCV